MNKDQNDIVISRKNLPTGLGLGALTAYFLLLTHLGAPTWAFWIFYVFAAVIVLAGIVRLFRTREVDLLAIAHARPAPILPTAPARRDTFTLKGDEIVIERLCNDVLRVSIRDANGNQLYCFKDYSIPPGSSLHLHDVRVETDVRITY